MICEFSPFSISNAGESTTFRRGLVVGCLSCWCRMSASKSGMEFEMQWNNRQTSPSFDEDLICLNPSTASNTAFPEASALSNAESKGINVSETCKPKFSKANLAC